MCKRRIEQLSAKMKILIKSRIQNKRPKIKKSEFETNKQLNGIINKKFRLTTLNIYTHSQSQYIIYIDHSRFNLAERPFI